MAETTIPAAPAHCKNCRFWAFPQSDYTDAAECRRMPPARSGGRMAVRYEGARTVTVGRGLWPLVGEYDGCGEFRLTIARDCSN